MRKYLVPCVALLGIALLSPGAANAAGLVIKSRAIPAGQSRLMPVLVVPPIGGSGEIWGIDMGLQFDTNVVGVPNPAAAFSGVGATASDVVVTGTGPFVGGGTPPSLYVGYVRGASQMPNGAVNHAGNLQLSTAAAATRGTVVPITAPNYNVRNTGAGTDNQRPGASAVTSTAVQNAPVVAEPLALVDIVPGAGGITVPQNRVAVGEPGNLAGLTSVAINAADLGNLAAGLVGKVTLSDYQRIVADTAPLRGYVAATNPGANYGDGSINAADLGQLAAFLVGKAPNFPQ
jgi:hypothetical protein